MTNQTNYTDIEYQTSKQMMIDEYLQCDSNQSTAPFVITTFVAVVVGTLMYTHPGPNSPFKHREKIINQLLECAYTNQPGKLELFLIKW